MIMKYDWYSGDEDNKIVRRNAANSFLSDVLDNGIADVAGLDPAKKKKAKEKFDEKLRNTPNGGPLPDGVEVICIEADTRKMSDLVVFVLYPEGPSASGDLWRKRWVAAWAPY
jgi:hypothetical protein